MSNHLIFVSCTYQRPQRIAFLRRHIDTIFSRIDNYTWIIVEDGAALDPQVSILTAGLNVIYLNVGPTRDKGNVQRNLALETIRDKRIGGESEFIARFARTVDDLDLSLCHDNKMCFVSHNEPLDSPVRVG